MAEEWLKTPSRIFGVNVTDIYQVMSVSHMLFQCDAHHHHDASCHTVCEYVDVCMPLLLQFTIIVIVLFVVSIAIPAALVVVV